MRDFFLPLEPGAFYHVFNRGNNGDKIFYQPRNYHYFLQQLSHYLSNYLQFYTYCLLPNHFHLLIRVKDSNELQVELTSVSSREFSESVSEQFRRFFLSYAAAIKKQEHRTGSLFEKNFKRLKVPDADYLRYIINYIHWNPYKHHIASEFYSYPFSSYRELLAGQSSWLQCKEVLSWFGDKGGFIKYHAEREIIARAS